jgi:rod shape-determining protein MreC
MQRRGNLFPVFVLFLILSILLIVFSTTGFLRGLTGPFEQLAIPLQRSTLGMFQSFNTKSDTGDLSKLRTENTKLIAQLSKQKELEKENQALRDQFQTESPSSLHLLPAQVIGMVSLVPGDTSLDEITIDKGKRDGVHAGSVVIFKDNVVGKITQASEHIATVDLITHKGTLFTAETVKTSTLGIITSRGNNEVVLDNVVLSDKLENGDIVITKGNVDKNGSGYPPHLVVGKIASVNKKASALFQAAEIQSLVDFEKLSMVFVITDNK